MGRRLRRPYSWTAVAAIIMAVATAMLGIRAGVAIHQANVPPAYEVEVVVEGEHGYNISQQSVDAELAGNPVRSAIPLTLVATDRLLTGDEALRGEVPENQIVLSTRLDAPQPGTSQAAQRFSGVGMDRELAGSEDEHGQLSYEVEKSFSKNVSVGHGPKAVVAAAHTAAVVLDDSTTSSAIFWFAVVGLSAMLTAACLAGALRFRSRWASRHRRLAAAQRKLARVVLDLEALEATYLATDEARRPEGFTEAWQQLQDLSLDAARREDPLVQALFAPDTCLDEATGAQLAGFEADARKLAGLADSLMGAGSVHANLAGTGSTFDKLSAPINDAATQLLIRLEDAPGKMVRSGDLEALRGALGSLLEAARGDTGHRSAIGRWSAAEHQLAIIAGKIIGRLRRYPHGRAPRVKPVGPEHNQLRSSLGLPPVSNDGALHQLKHADALARAILGDTLSTDRQPADRASARPAWLSLVQRFARGQRPAGEGPGTRGPGRKIGALAGLLVCSLIAAGVIAGSLPNKPRATHEGSGQGMELQIDDRAQLIDESSIRHYVEEDFAEVQHIIVAVRDAESYLEFVQEDGRQYRDATVDSVRSAIWRIKGEFSDRADPQSTELPADLTIIPLLITDAGKGIVPGLISGAVVSGDASWGSTTEWEYGSIRESSYPAMEVASAAEDFAVVLKQAGYQQPDYSPVLLYWMLVFMLFFSVINLVQIFQYLLGATSRFTRFSRGSRTVQRARRELEKLAMGLQDSQINAVAVLGAAQAGRADEAGQRLFERALMMAWRESEELLLLPLGQRLLPGYAARANHLAQLVALLSERDADVARRAEALVQASRGAGGGTPAAVALPGRQ